MNQRTPSSFDPSASPQAIVPRRWARLLLLLCLAALGGMAFTAVHFGLQWIRTSRLQADRHVASTVGTIVDVRSQRPNEVPRAMAGEFSGWLVVEYASGGESRKVRVSLPRTAASPEVPTTETDSAYHVGQQITLYYPAARPSLLVTDASQLTLARADQPHNGWWLLLSCLAIVALSLFAVWLQRWVRPPRQLGPGAR